MFTNMRSHAWRKGRGPSLAVLILMVCGTMLMSDFVSALEITRKGYRIAHKGQVDTDLTFNEFFGSSFAITAWVMPEFTHNWKGAIFTVKGLPGSGTFQVGQGDYRSGNGGFLQADDPVLEVTMNGATARYLAPEYQRRKWNHIAIVRGNVMFAGATLQLYLNGKKLQAFTRVETTDAGGNTTYQFNPALDIHFSQAGSPLPNGTLRLGREGRAQFYGLIDDVAVYNKSMTPSELTALMNASSISTVHPNLISWFTFDTYSGSSLPLVPPHTATPNARAYSVKNAHPHSNASDSLLFDNLAFASPSAVTRRLPFSPGQIWQVIQEFDEKGGSHNGTAAFSWDFGRLDKPTTQDPVVASAPGLLTYVDDSANGAGVVEVIPGQEADVYMHTAAGSWWKTFVAPGDYLLYPQPTQSVTWLPVSQGQALAKLDASENHLHRSVRYMGDGSEYTVGALLPSIPTSFDNYERFREDLPLDCNKTNASHWQKDGCWTHVLRGMPRKGQVVKRTY
jgi:hypothetical protein